MKKLQAKNHGDFPMFLNAEMIAKILGVSISSACELINEKDFPSVRIGKRFIVLREDLVEWIERKMKKENGL